MIEALSLQKLPSTISADILSPFRTLTILCITSMVLCCIFGFMGYGGGVMIIVEEAKKSKDEERDTDLPDDGRRRHGSKRKSRQRRLSRGPLMRHIPPCPTSSTDNENLQRTSETAIGTKVIYCNLGRRQCRVEHGAIFIEQPTTLRIGVLGGACPACNLPRRTEEVRIPIVQRE